MPNESEIVVRTRRDVQALSVQEIKRRMADPTLNEEMNRAIQVVDAPVEHEDIVLSQEEIDAAAAAKAADEAAEAEAATKQAAEAAAAVETAKKAAADAEQAARQAAENAEEDAYLTEAGVRVTRDASGRVTRLVQEYQATDDAGNGIGNRTHLEARSWPELVVKQKIAHENAVRFADRLKKQKPATPQQVPAGLLTREEFNQAQADILGDDKEKAAEAKKKLIQHAAASKTVTDVPLAEKVRQAEVSYQFMVAHVNDFYPCTANSTVLMSFLKENNLEFTLENLEFAYPRVLDKLASRPGVRVPAAVPNPPAAPVVPAPPAPPVAPVTPVAAPVSTPAAPITPAAPVAAPNPPAPAPRPAPNGGLEPGSMAGGRMTQPAGITLKDVAKWTAAEMKKNMADPKIGPQVRKLIADRNEAVRKAKLA